MTDLDERTQNLAAFRLRRSTIYTPATLRAADTVVGLRTDLTADPALRADEGLILADPNASGEIMQLGHMLNEPPVGTPPPLPPQPADPPKVDDEPAYLLDGSTDTRAGSINPSTLAVRRPMFKHGKRLNRHQWSAIRLFGWAAAAVGIVVGAWVWGWLSHDLVAGAIR